MPAGATALCVHDQSGVPTLWALCDADRPTVSRSFRMAGTGHPIADDIGPHVGSVVLMGGKLVLHVFEVL